MLKSPESINVDYLTLDEIYPFNLVIESNGHLLICHSGPALAARASQPMVGQLLTDHFVFQRPSVDIPSYDCLLSMAGKLVCLAAIDSDIVLRGQIVAIDENRFLYLSTLHITSTRTLADMKIQLSDFPAHDLVPDVLILQRMKETQLDELTRQNKELALVIKERDQFDHFANTDAMTQLLNRRGFNQQAAQYLESNNGVTESVILLIDVDNFKTINDMYGHSAGDAVLKEVSDRLNEHLGESSVIGRWGGDEFVVLCGIEMAYGSDKEKTHDCIQALRGEVSYNDKTIDICLSCGIVDTTVSNDLERLIHYADLTMYEGRRTESGKTILFQDDLKSTIKQREEISRLIQPAIDNRQFVPYFQPIVDIASGELVGFEALARWPSSEIGMVFPVDFIAVAESKCLMQEFDFMMLDLVVEQLARWHHFYPDIKVHINLSAPSFTDDLPECLVNLMQRVNVPCSHLIVEITETSLFVSSGDIGKVIKDLVSLGFSVELDDFGTGYSSLMHLKDFPVTGLKVDMSFVRDAAINEHTRRLLSGILNLSNCLNLHSVAEGVETVEQLQMLTDLDCDSAQGYLFAKPMPADECTAMLELRDCRHSLPKAA